VYVTAVLLIEYVPRAYIAVWTFLIFTFLPFTFLLFTFLLFTFLIVAFCSFAAIGHGMARKSWQVNNANA